MKTALIVTLGARDLQLDASFKDDEKLKNFAVEVVQHNNSNLMMLQKPREDGLLINSRFADFKNHIRFPIIIPAIDYVLEGSCQIDKLILVLTDQSDKRFKVKDTICFGGILTQYVKWKYENRISNIDEIVFKERMLDYDFTYQASGNEINRIFKGTSAWNVFLLPQGGIDSINTSILFRCIERFPYFSQLAKPEGIDGIVKQSFPNSFRSTLNLQRLKYAVQFFNYSFVDEGLTDNDYILTLCRYAYYRLGLDYEKAWNTIHDYNASPEDAAQFGFLKSLRKDVALVTGQHDILKLQSDLYAFVKIRWKQGYYADFLMRLFALSENLLIPVINQHFKVVVRYTESDGHKDWNDFINNQPELLAFLKTQEFYGQSLNFSYPNRNAYISIYRFMVQQRQVEEDTVIPDETLITLNTLAALRNKIAHGLHGISREVILRELENRNQDIDKLFEGLDKYFGIEGPDDMGVYSRINERIMSLLY
jgi:hypothetical protein